MKAAAAAKTFFSRMEKVSSLKFSHFQFFLFPLVARAALHFFPFLLPAASFKKAMT
jgi:hypothetical protein